MAEENDYLDRKTHQSRRLVHSREHIFLYQTNATWKMTAHGNIIVESVHCHLQNMGRARTTVFPSMLRIRVKHIILHRASSPHARIEHTRP